MRPFSSPITVHFRQCTWHTSTLHTRCRPMQWRTVSCMLTYLCAASAVVSSVSLAAELDLLLHLIALPPGTSCQRSANTLQQQQPRFITGAVAALYAAQVLSLSGPLLCFIHPTYPTSHGRQDSHWLGHSCRSTTDALWFVNGACSGSLFGFVRLCLRCVHNLVDWTPF